MGRHRRTRRELKKQRKIIVVSLIAFLFIMVGGYAAFQTNLNITAKGNIVDKSRVIQSWTITSNEDFHTDYYRENIVSATFLDNNNVPSNAIESWNVSEDKKHGGVMAWVIQNSEDNTKFDLYIGANGGVIANEDSGYLFFAFLGLRNIEFNNNFDTSNATTMWDMFAGGNNLTSLNVSSFDTSNVTDMRGTFSAWNGNTGTWGNRSLTTIIGLENFDTHNVTKMGDMFSGQPLVLLNLSSFDTSNVTDMFHMFNGCEKLTYLNLCSFNTKNVLSVNNMFAGTTILNAIYVGPNWTTEQADTTGMFLYSNISSVTTGQCS